MTAPLNLVVIYASDIEASRRFYTACGLAFVRERHGRGPVHYAAELPGGTVLELYPRRGGPPTRTRLGLAVADIDRVLRSLAAAGCDAGTAAGDGGGFTVRDPDGNAVELVEPRDQ